MSTTTDYLSGTVTLTDDGALECSNTAVQVAVAGKLAAFGDVQATFDYLRAWKDAKPLPPNPSPRRAPAGAAQPVPGYDKTVALTFLQERDEALLRRYPQVRLAAA